MKTLINQKRLRTWEVRGGVFCFVAGLLAPLLGSLLTVIEWIVGSAAHPWIHVASTALFIVAIPLILFAGFCLDWAERGQKNLAHNPHTSSKRTVQMGTGRTDPRKIDEQTRENLQDSSCRFVFVHGPVCDSSVRRNPE